MIVPRKSFIVFLSLIQDYSGTLDNRQLKTEMKEYEISLHQPIKIKKINNYLKKSLNLQKDLYILNTRLLSNKSSHFALDELDEVKVSCKECHTMGEKTALITIYDKKNNKHRHWIKFEVTAKVKTLSPLKAISVTNTPLQAKYFEWKNIYSQTPEKYFTDLKRIRFHKVNHIIKQNSPLLKRSLNSINLVRVGRIANIQMTNGFLKLKGQALPMRSGKIGEIISLKNTRTKKIIVGKIIDNNLVEVEI